MIYGKRKLFFILFLFLLIVISIAIYVINAFGLKTVDIEKTILEHGMNVNALVIQKEDIVYFNGKNNLEIEIQEGDKIPLGSIIANTKNVVFYNQDSLNLEIINWKLENELYQEKPMFKQDLDKIQLEIENLKASIEEKKKLNNYKKIESLENEKNQLLHKKQLIEGSFRFAFLDRTGLEDIKSKLLNNKSDANFIKKYRDKLPKLYLL